MSNYRDEMGVKANLAQWLQATDMGQYVTQKERAFFARVLKGRLADDVVQTALPEWMLWPQERCLRVGKDVCMQVDELAWANDSLDLLLMPHGLEYAVSPQRALIEAYRVLRSGGRVVLTGFNLYSLWRFSRWFDGKHLPRKEECVPLPELKKQVRALGFAIEEGQFMVYVPAVRSRNAIGRWRFLEHAGDRWWPHAAAVYGLVLVKRQAGVHVLPEWEDCFAEEGGQMVLGTARAKVD